MELLTNNTIFLILLGFMPLMAFSMAFIVVFNLKHIDNRTALNCTFLGFLMIVPALTILLTLTK
tara:strand:+ start:334 stop:525 length:192 start_codon:yes stop_codon:yes gene_type:complete